MSSASFVRSTVTIQTLFTMQQIKSHEVLLLDRAQSVDSPGVRKIRSIREVDRTFIYEQSDCRDIKGRWDASGALYGFADIPLFAWIKPISTTPAAPAGLPAAAPAPKPTLLDVLSGKVTAWYKGEQIVAVARQLVGPEGTAYSVCTATHAGKGLNVNGIPWSKGDPEVTFLAPKVKLRAEVWTRGTNRHQRLFKLCPGVDYPKVGDKCSSAGTLEHFSVFWGDASTTYPTISL